MGAPERPLEGSPSPPASPPACTSGHASSCARTSAPHPNRSHPQLRRGRTPHIPQDTGKRRKDAGGGLWKGPPRPGVAAARRGTRQGHVPVGTKRGARIICSNCDGKPQEFALQKVCREVNRRPNSLQVLRGIGSSCCVFLAPVPERWLGPCVSSGWDGGSPRECHAAALGEPSHGQEEASGGFSMSEWEPGAWEMCRASQESP